MHEFVTVALLPLALSVLMFGLGLSVSIVELHQLIRCPRPLLLGIAGHIVCLPAIAFAIALVMRLPPPAAVSLIVITACPCGLTSNVLAFVGRADVALSISMTAVSSLISLISTPLIVMLALDTFYGATSAGDLNLGAAIEKLFLFGTLPTLAGALIRLLHPDFTRLVLVWLRPVAFGVLLTTIAYIVLMNWQLVLDNLVTIAPLALLLNLSAVGLGLWLGRRFYLKPRQKMTLAIGLGMHNATMATFIAVNVLDRIDYAATPTIYGTIMVLTGLAVIRFGERREA